MPSMRTRVGSAKGSVMNEKAIQVFDFDGWAWKGAAGDLGQWRPDRHSHGRTPMTHHGR
jgi:hypothetical protein